MIDILCADVLDWCESYEGEPFHAILCDPSYALSKKKRLDMDAPVNAEIETVGDVIAAYHALQQWGDVGFMNRAWDDSTAFNPETWRALARHLHPGGFIMAFASSRGDHRLAVAMEDAGLVILPKIFIWLNGQSFPKATRPFKSPKEWREVQHRWLGWMGKLGNWILRKWDSPPKYYLDFIFNGYRYGRQALKNCAEPIIVAQKPYVGKPVECIVDTGAGALNIDKARVATAVLDSERRTSIRGASKFFGLDAKQDGERHNAAGRWPPNFVLCHIPSHYICQQCQAVHPIQPVVEVCPDCGGDLMRVEGCQRVGVKRVRGDKRGATGGKVQHQFDGDGIYGSGQHSNGDHSPMYGDPDGLETVADFRCAEGCVVARLGEQSGERPSAGHYHNPAGNCIKRDGSGSLLNFADCVNKDGRKRTMQYSGQTGTAARFYPQASWEHEVAEQLAQADPVHYQPKAPKKERNSGLDDFYWRRDKASPTGFVRVSKEEWEALPKRQRARGNIHPTQKPIALTKWLATLLLPPPEYAPRRIMVPFGGKMSEAIGALLAGWEEIVAIEMYQDYCDAGKARAAFWSTRQLELPAPPAPLRAYHVWAP